jgi:hypothetical protein
MTTMTTKTDLSKLPTYPVRYRWCPTCEQRLPTTQFAQAYQMQPIKECIVCQDAREKRLHERQIREHRIEKRRKELVAQAKKRDKASARRAGYRKEGVRRTNRRYIQMGGEVRTMAGWAQRSGVSYITFKKRIERGWSIDAAIFTPPLGKLAQCYRANGRKRRHITFRGETLTLKEWAARVGVTLETMRHRVKKWPLEEALTTPPVWQNEVVRGTPSWEWNTRQRRGQG